MSETNTVPQRPSAVPPLKLAGLAAPEKKKSLSTLAVPKSPDAYPPSVAPSWAPSRVVLSSRSTAPSFCPSGVDRALVYTINWVEEEEKPDAKTRPESALDVIERQKPLSGNGLTAVALSSLDYVVRINMLSYCGTRGPEYACLGREGTEQMS